MKGNSRAETPSYLCASCGYRSGKWMGFCPQCKNQDALVEAVAPARRSTTPAVVSATDTRTTIQDRQQVGIAEFDRVLGGGIVPGGVVLLGGEPGVGKSTLLLHVANSLASGGKPVLIATAEESTHQVQMRSRRIGVDEDGVQIASVYDVDDIISIASGSDLGAVIIDSIQTVSTLEATGSAGGTSQVRESASRLIAFAKQSGTPVVLVGHVTKDGSIAGPRTLEHMVDVVLYLEGEADHGLRFLRGMKNRYGSVNEVGVFEMTAAGLVEVADPSGVLVAHRDEKAPGSVLFPTVEGKRPLVVEVQALAVSSSADMPRRAVNGLPTNRVHQVIGVLERHAAMPLRLHEVYVNVMGGIKVTEPGIDLAVALAIASSYADVPMGRTAAWGELGLTGDIRPVGRSSTRRTEAERIGANPIITGDEKATRLFEVLIECGFGASMR
ncbi:MAG: DNA repair protein RadA [Acidimicrobiia bacterium]